MVLGVLEGVDLSYDRRSLSSQNGDTPKQKSVSHRNDPWLYRMEPYEIDVGDRDLGD